MIHSHMLPHAFYFRNAVLRSVFDILFPSLHIVVVVVVVGHTLPHVLRFMRGKKSHGIFLQRF